MQVPWGCMSDGEPAQVQAPPARARRSWQGSWCYVIELQRGHWLCHEAVHSAAKRVAEKAAK